MNFIFYALEVQKFSIQLSNPKVLCLTLIFISKVMYIIINIKEFYINI